MPEEVTFTAADKLQIQIFEQEICPDKFDDTALPSDVHIVEYTVGGETYYDAVRAYTKADIFDAYYDKLRTIGKIVNIKSGYGRIRPNLYGKIKQ